MTNTPLRPALDDATIDRWTRLLAESTIPLLMGDRASLTITVAVDTDRGVRGIAELRLAGDGASVGARSSDGAPDADVVLVADQTDWDRFFSPIPPPPFHSVFAMRMRVPTFRVEGDEHRFAQFAGPIRRALEAGRAAVNDDDQRSPRPETTIDRSAIHGRYVEIETGAGRTWVHVEQAGTGRDLLLLHTAGSDGRQAHPLMSDPRLTEHFRITSFDLPGHGRSAMVPGQLDGTYSLTLDDYRATVLGVVESLGLRRPFLCGASMAGQICLEMAISASDEFEGIIACEASDFVEGRRSGWMRDPSIDTARFAPEWIHGLLSPLSPIELQELVQWTYSQGGVGTFAGDIDFYSGGWDARERLAGIDTGRIPLVLLTGEYDYSCTPAMSSATAARIPGARFVEMPGLGHFPIAENPERFIPHLLDAIEMIDLDRAAAVDTVPVP